MLPFEPIDGERPDRHRDVDICVAPLERRYDLICRRGLGEIVGRAELYRLDRRGDAAVTRQHDDIRVLVDILQPLQELQPGHIGQPQVDHRIFRRALDRHTHCIRAVVRADDVESTCLERARKHLTERRVVFREQQIGSFVRMRCRRLHRGS
jgi:hypothetical protein